MYQYNLFSTRHLILIIVFMGFNFALSAQQLTIYGQRSLWDTDSICDIELVCDYRLHIPGGQILIGYAHHPVGNLWLVTTTSSPDLIQYLRIYNVEIVGCKYTLLYDIELPPGWRVVGAVNIDHLGRLYIRLIQRDILTNEFIPTLTRIANPSNPVFETVLYTDLNHQFWEVHFSVENIYLVDNREPFIRVYSNDFILLDTLIMDKHIWGLTSFSNRCDSVVTYATHMGYSTEVFRMIGPDTMMYISTIDMKTLALTPVCNYWMGNAVNNTNLTSPLEFLSSDPECDLLIDLDRDNSTGVYPYDYRDANHYCTSTSLPICDDDVFIYTSAPLDSIRFSLAGIREAGDEMLILNGAPPGISLTMRTDSTWVMTSTIPTDPAYREGLLAVRYLHNGQQRTGGERQVILQGFNSIKESVKIKAQIYLRASPYAGEDATLLICGDTLIQSFSALTGGQAGGYWNPSLVTGGDLFNATLDLSPKYTYIIQDPICGNDTSVITIARDMSMPVDLLGMDQVLCAGDTLSLIVTHGATSFLWDDGSNATSRQVTDPGAYWVSVATGGGCTFSDSIYISPGALWEPVILITDPTCRLPNGQIMIDNPVIPPGVTLMINGTTLSTPFIDQLVSGVYRVTSISGHGCESDRWVTLEDQELLSVTMDSLVYVQEGSWQTVLYTENNGVVLSDIQFDPTNSIRWNTSAIEVYGDQDHQYVITFVDHNGCEETHTLNVKVEHTKGLYLPNIFRPSSTVGNDEWKAEINSPYLLELLRIYDRWGNVVHQSSMDASWDGSFGGQSCPAGVYVYQLIVTHAGNGERKVLKGDLLLMR